MEAGDYVIDTEDDDPDLAVVVNRPGLPIEEWTVSPAEGEERTVAEDNPEYAADEPVVTVVYVESGFEGTWPGWSEADPAELFDGARDHDVNLYRFPESRLRPLSDEEADAMRTDGTVDMGALRERLDDAGWTLETDDDGTIVSEKMGEQYRIHPTGEVEGEGQVRGPLENLVAEYTE